MDVDGNTGKGDDLLGEQLLGSSDWPDFEGDVAFTVPPKPMPELYASQGEQVRCRVFNIYVFGM